MSLPKGIIVIANNDRKTAPKKVEFVNEIARAILHLWANRQRDRPSGNQMWLARPSTNQNGALNGKIIEPHAGSSIAMFDYVE